MYAGYQDISKAPSLRKLEQAVADYKARFGQAPTVAYVSSRDATLTIEGLEVIADTVFIVQPNCYFLGTRRTH